MIIKKLHIDRFGGLENFSLSFHDGFNLIYGNNEDGKTTVMSFIRLMFYGAGTKKNDLFINLRKRFMPFSGESAGGEIEFSHNGKNYLLSKQFGKTPRSDKTTLMDLDADRVLSINTEQEIGERFFSLSADAFERSIYIGSLPTDGDGSAELSEKLRRVTFSGEDGYSYEQVKQQLQGSMKKLRTPRRVGRADELESEISKLLSELESAGENEKKRAENSEMLKKHVLEFNKLGSLCERLKSEKKHAEEIKSAHMLRAEYEQRRRYFENKSFIGDMTRETLRKCKSDLSRLGTLRAEKSATLKSVPDTPNADFSEIPKTADRIEEINTEIGVLSSRLSARKSGFAVYISFALTALLFAVSVFTAVTDMQKAVFPLSVAVISLISAILFLLSSRKKLKKQTADIKSEISKLSQERILLEEKLTSLNERKKTANAAQEAASQSQMYLKQLDDEISSLSKELCSALRTDSTDSIEEQIESLSSAFARLDECERSLNSSPYKSLDDSTLEEKLAHASNLPNVNYEECEREIQEIEERIRITLQATERLKAENESLQKSARPLAVIEKEISEKKALLSELNKSYASLSLAAEVLEEANIEMRKSFAPELNRMTGELLAGITDGKHEKISVSDSLSLTLTERGAAPFSAEYLSAGTLDQAELSLRISVARLTGGKNALPLLLDDVLMQYDDKRTLKALEFLSDYASENQVLLFTCHGFQKDSAKADSVVYM